jgi:COP9 signalosome complex subunit 2
MVQKYRSMLEYLASVTRNECTEAINVILDTLATATHVSVLAEMYEITLVALKSSNNDRLWFSTNLKLAKVYLEERNWQEVDRMITVLKDTCKLPDGSDDPSKGTLLLEVYCIEIQLCSVSGNMVRMREVYPKTLNLNAAVADPRIMGIIREEGGKMQMAESNWDEAYNELYEAFRNYQEAGNPRAKDLLKYVVVASMLTVNDINPFAAREAKVFADDKEIIAMSDLRQCLEANDLARFERIVRNKQYRIVDEPFLMTYIQPLRRRMREQVLVNLTKPYRKVTIAFIARELCLNEEEVECLLVDMILDNKLVAQIDQIKGHVLLEPSAATTSSAQSAGSGGGGGGGGGGGERYEDELYSSLSQWADKLAAVQEGFGVKLMM